VSIEENISLAPFTTFGIGGRAHFFCRASSLEEIKQALAFAKEKTLPILVLGGGSNVLLPDEGWSGIVVKIELRGMAIEEKEDQLLIVGAGESWDATVAYAISHNLWGIENLSGIPGTAGGAVVQNIGAYGAAISEVVAFVDVFDRERAVVERLSAKDCQFNYRDSLFKHGEKYIVLTAALRLSKKATPNLSYAGLKDRMGTLSGELQTIRDTVRAIRGEKFPDLEKEGTAGSFFKNPIISEEEADRLRAQFPGMPLFPVPESRGIKLPLAYMLDKGLHLRGFCEGNARLFEQQPLVIAAKRGATAEEVIRLAQLVQKKVQEAYNIVIEPEVRIIANV
jgi:UDP-N-acetylmuramate dehydrogenase